MPSEPKSDDSERSRSHHDLIAKARAQAKSVPSDEDTPLLRREAERLRRAVALPSQIGPYRILEALGEGGMGTVYLAEQHEPIRRRVALKVIKLGMDTKEVLARFESERQALALMNHPNIAKVLDAGTSTDARPYFVMEYVAGERITSYCDREQLDMRQRLGVFVQVCGGVQHAHQKGVIHRDIKPSNILVATHDDKPVPKIIDFGVAKAIGHELTEQTLFTEQGQLVGTPEYMSPEQAGATDSDVDTRSDVYSLGVLLYEILVGALPFDSRALRRAGYAEIQRIIREVEPPKPSTRLSGLGTESGTIAEKRRSDPRRLAQQLRGDLDWIAMKALEKDASRRYATVSALAEDIARHIRHEPVSAGPPSASYRFRKFLRRNKGAAASVAAVFVVLLAGIVVSLDFAIGERRAKESAEQAQQIKQLALADSAAQAARLAAQRGKWEPVLEHADLALALGHPDPIEMRLQKIMAWDALYDRPSGMAELDQLMALTDSEIGVHRGQVELWRGVYDLWKPLRQDAGVALIRSAIERGLPVADDAYARALIATGLPDTIEFLNRALELDPFHYRASLMLGAAVMFNGNVGKAIEHFGTSLAKFPEDPSAWVGIAICRALDGDTAGMSDALANIGPPYDPNFLQTLGVAFAGVPQALVYADSSDPAAPNSASQFVEALVSVAPHLMALVQSMGIAGNSEARFPSIDFMPPPIAATWWPTIESLVPILLEKHQAAIEPLESAIPFLDDGFPRFLYAKCLFATGRFEEAEEAAWYAATSPSMVKVQRGSTYLALKAELARTRPDPKRTLRNLKAFAILENLQPETRAWNSSVARRFGDAELARSLAVAARHDNPTHVGLLVELAKAEVALGAYGPAVVAAQTAVELEPANNEAETVLNRARSFLGQIGPSKDPSEAPPSDPR